MLIAHLITGLNIGGAENFLKRLITSYDKKEQFEHVVLNLMGQGVIGSQLRSGGIKVYDLNCNSAARLPFAILKMVWLIIYLRPDVFQTWMYHSDLIGGIVARVLGIRNVVWSIRSTHIEKSTGPRTLMIRKLCAALSHYFPKIIVCNATRSRDLHKSLGYAPDKLLVIPNGFQPNAKREFYPAKLSFRDEYKIDPSTKLVVSVGRFNPVKDHRTFIKSAAMLAEKRKEVRFVMIGRDIHSSNAELSSLISSTKRPDLFYLLGERDDVSFCLSLCDVFCLHSISEGFPNALGEAMAIGLPCVTTDVGDASYLLGDRRWVVPPESPEDLAIKLDELLSLSPSERVEFGNALSTRVQTCFSMDNVKSLYSDLYRSLTCQKAFAS